jgi:hypothetical protein
MLSPRHFSFLTCLVMQQCDEGSLHDASLNCPICKPSQADLYTRQARLLVIPKLPDPCRVKCLLTLLYGRGSILLPICLADVILFCYQREGFWVHRVHLPISKVSKKISELFCGIFFKVNLLICSFLLACRFSSLPIFFDYLISFLTV